MNSAQIHLALNHVPLLLSVIGALILIFGMIRKNDSIVLLSLYILVGAAIFTLPVFFTGEGTEEMVEHLPGANESAIEEHEEMGKVSFVIILISGLVALAGIFVRKSKSLAKFSLSVVVILSLLSFGAMAQTAHLGGLIRHSELKAGSASTGSESDNENENAGDSKESSKDVAGNDDEEDDD